MYNIQNKSDYFFMYDRSTGRTIDIGNKEDLIKYIITDGNSYRPKDKNIKSLNLDDFELIKHSDYTGYDKEIFTIYNDWPNEETFIVPKRYLFYDGEYRIIDIRNFWEDIRKALYNHLELNNKSNYYFGRKINNEIFEYGDTIVRLWYNRENFKYKFRVDPIPCTHKHRRKYYRRIKKHNLLKQVMDPEYKEFLHPKYKQYPDWIDDSPRADRGRTWKNNKKIKHQWEKNLKK